MSHKKKSNNKLENQNLDRIILAFLREEATANEIEILRKWLSNEPSHQNIFESVKHYWENSELTINASDSNIAYNRMMSKSFAKSNDGVININSSNKKTTTKQKAFDIPWLTIAATIIIFFSLAGAVYYIVNSNQIPKQEIVSSRLIIKQNPKGQKLTTYLPDGSKVILNSLSEIRFKSPFVGKERIVELKGEAFFEVKKNKNKPFKVISKSVTTTALGTSFNINSKIDNLVEVALVSGKVSVVDGTMKAVILNPGKYVIAGDGDELIIQEFNYLEKVGWKDGILSFNENSLTTIFSKLEDWYGVDIEVDENDLGKYHYTGNYKNETLEEVLIGISFVHQFNYQITGDTVQIMFNNKNNKPM